MANGIHHIHKRKRKYKKLEKYPHPQFVKRVFDRCAYGIAIIGPTASFHQIFKIWIEKNASGVSVFAFTTYVIINVFWLLYGLLHKEKALVFLYSLWIVSNSLVALGAILYG